jgi:hypothetical protein
VKEFLDGFEVQACTACKDRVTASRHVPWYHYRRWTMRDGSGPDYDYPFIIRHCIVTLLAMYIHVLICISPKTDGLDLVVWGVTCAWLMARTGSLVRIAISKERVEKPKPCAYALDFRNGMPVTSEVKLTLDSVGVVTKSEDPYHAKQRQ